VEGDIMGSIFTQKIQEINLLNNIISESYNFSKPYKTFFKDNINYNSSIIMDNDSQVQDYKNFLVQRILKSSEALFNYIEKTYVLEDEFSNYLEINNILNYILIDVNNVNLNALKLVNNILKDLKEVFIYKTAYFKDNNLENFKNIYVVFESKFLDFQENYYTNYVNINPDYKKTCVKVANVLRNTYLEEV
jgi:hypothetical protein